MECPVSVFQRNNHQIRAIQKIEKADPLQLTDIETESLYEWNVAKNLAQSDERDRLERIARRKR